MFVVIVSLGSKFSHYPDFRWYYQRAKYGRNCPKTIEHGIGGRVHLFILTTTSSSQLGNSVNVYMLVKHYWIQPAWRKVTLLDPTCDDRSYVLTMLKGTFHRWKAQAAWATMKPSTSHSVQYGPNPKVDHVRKLPWYRRDVAWVSIEQLAP